jgi:transcriptional regulator with XRE-family HTH domain
MKNLLVRAAFRYRVHLTSLISDTERYSLRMSEGREVDMTGSQPSLDLGARLRAQRQSKGMSLREMARRLGRSPSAISQFETGKVQPSVSTLFDIVELLGTSIDALLGAEEPGTAERPAATATSALLPSDILDMPNRLILERAADHPAIEFENGVQWVRLSRSMSGVEFMLVTYSPGSWSSGADGRFMSHAGHEFAYLLGGSLTVEVKFDGQYDTYEVRAGDSITFPATMAHRLGNSADEPAVALWCVFAAGKELEAHRNGIRVSSLSRSPSRQKPTAHRRA